MRDGGRIGARDGALAGDGPPRFGESRVVQHRHQMLLRRQRPHRRLAGPERDVRRGRGPGQRLVQLHLGRRRGCRKRRGAARHPPRDGQEGCRCGPLHHLHHDEGSEEGAQPERRLLGLVRVGPRRRRVRVRGRGCLQQRARRLHRPQGHRALGRDHPGVQPLVQDPAIRPDIWPLDQGVRPLEAVRALPGVVDRDGGEALDDAHHHRAELHARRPLWRRSRRRGGGVDEVVEGPRATEHGDVLHAHQGLHHHRRRGSSLGHAPRAAWRRLGDEPRHLHGADRHPGARRQSRPGEGPLPADAGRRRRAECHHLLHVSQGPLRPRRHGRGFALVQHYVAPGVGRRHRYLQHPPRRLCEAQPL
mmetsp:Transcript_91350/g.263660  ORF Transcript_91350/g.263660 Transcript_91350/m.263660 type:complete len:361 (-) Transcript_91350:772-1854(-)